MAAFISMFLCWLRIFVGLLFCPGTTDCHVASLLAMTCRRSDRQNTLCHGDTDKTDGTLYVIARSERAVTICKNRKQNY